MSTRNKPLKSIKVLVTDDEHDALRVAAFEEGVSLAAFIRKILRMTFFKFRKAKNLPDEFKSGDQCQ